MTHDSECEQLRATTWVQCNCEMRATTDAAIEAWVAECRETVAAA